MGLESFLPNKNERANDLDALKEGTHFENLYDQNEDLAGEKTNLGTGNAIKNDQDVESPHGLVINEQGVLKNLKKKLEKDPATALLLANGFDELGNKIEEKKNSKKKAA